MRFRSCAGDARRAAARCLRLSRAALLVAGTLAVTACSPVTVGAGAGAAVGVTAAQERGIGGAASDTRIRLQIDGLLLQESKELFLDVHLQVQEGRVLLSGTVPDPEAAVDAVRLAWQVDGVREVINEIEVSDEDSFVDYARDRWIEARIQAKLLKDREVRSINYSIESVNQSVFLLGVAQSQEELDRVIAHTKNVPYVRRVVSYVVLKDDPARGS